MVDRAPRGTVRAVKRVVLPLIAVGLLAACGSSASDSGAPVASSAATSAPSAAPAPSDSGLPTNVPAALQFAAPLIGGGDIELTTLAGRPVLLWFWAPW